MCTPMSVHMEMRTQKRLCPPFHTQTERISTHGHLGSPAHACTVETHAYTCTHPLVFKPVPCVPNSFAKIPEKCKQHPVPSEEGAQWLGSEVGKRGNPTIFWS